MNGASSLADKLASKIAALSHKQRALLKLRAEQGLPDGHTLIARNLSRLGVTHVYGVSGTPIDETLAACSLQGIRVIGVRHQQAGVMMAIAQNYQCGRIVAAVIVSAGPGVTNTLTGVLVARDNGWPLVVLGGRRPLSMQGMGSFQDLDAIPIFQPICKWAALLESTADIPEYLQRAFITAGRGRPGPVYLDVPEEVLGGSSRDLLVDDLSPPAQPLDHESLAKVCRLLLAAKRPALIVGEGLRWSAPYAELQQLIEQWAIPVITSPMGQGIIPDDHFLCFNTARSAVQAHCDVVLIVGTQLDWAFRFGSELAAGAAVIQMDLEPGRISIDIPIAISLVGDSKAILQALISRMREEERQHDESNSHQDWLKFLQHKKEAQLKNQATERQVSSTLMSPTDLIRTLVNHIPREAIWVIDGNLILAAAQAHLSSHFPASRLTPGANGCIGTGIPFAIGTKLATPERPVVVVCGDAAFGFSAMEMETAVRHKVPIVVIVANNEGIGGAQKQNAFYPPDHERVTMFAPQVNNALVMTAFGGHAESVAKAEQLPLALARALAAGGPACIDVKLDPYSHCQKRTGNKHDPFLENSE